MTSPNLQALFDDLRFEVKIEGVARLNEPDPDPDELAAEQGDDDGAQ